MIHVLQLESIKTMYENLEKKLLKNRKSSIHKVEEFLSDKVEVLLNDLRREVKLMEARLRDNHQVRRL